MFSTCMSDFGFNKIINENMMKNTYNTNHTCNANYSFNGLNNNDVSNSKENNQNKINKLSKPLGFFKVSYIILTY